EGHTIQFADEGDVAHRIFPVVGAVVKVVDRKGFLKDDGVGALGHRHQNGIHVAHIVTPDHVGAVGKAAGMAVVGGAQQQGGGVDGAAGDHHNIGGKAGSGAVLPHHHAGDFASRVAGLQAF